MKSKRVSHEQQPEPRAVSLTLCNPDDLRRDILQVQLAIARRAIELFATRGREHGHDWKDWLQAETELVRPVSVSMSKSTNRITVHAGVVGFDETELKVSIEPRRITILGQKKTRGMKLEGGTIERTSSYPHQILKVVDLATPVTPERAVVELQRGVLKFELPTGQG